jgi:hypothetical protein
MHHHRAHRTQNLNSWRNLLYLCTAAVALVVHRTTSLGVLGSLIVGFMVSAALLWSAYVAIHARNSKGPGAS